jgi:hypothetical protein
MISMKMIAAGALAIATTGGVAAAQTVPEGRVYAFHSKAAGGCPVLDWHVVVGANNALTGMISWDEMKSMAKVSGAIGADRTFKMSATEVGGAGRTAAVDGQVRADGWLVANIKGPNVDCKGIAVPFYVQPQSAG